MSSVEDSPDIKGVMDSNTPVSSPLTGTYKKSFAFYSIKVRIPMILDRIADDVAKDKERILTTFGANDEDIKKYTENVLKFKNDILANKNYYPIQVDTVEAKRWNKWIEDQDDQHYFTNTWLFTECYVYRRLQENCQVIKNLNEFDPFEVQKKKSFVDSLEVMCVVAERLVAMVTQSENKRQDFITLLKICLWANKCDLSLSMGEDVKMKGKTQGDAGEDHLPALDPFQMNVDFESELLVNDADKIAEYVIANSAKETIFDIVCDNSGYEVFSDLCLAEFIVAQNIAQKVRFHVKSIPWYVSDVTPRDFHFVIKSCKGANYERQASGGRVVSSGALRKLGEQWQQYIVEGKFELMYDDFWTSPHAYKDMKNYDPELYRKLQRASAVLFKGDLNYRKLLADVNFPSTLDFESALQGFHPAPVISLRTVKADLICGLPEGLAATLDAKDDQWMKTGDYGTIQFCPKIEPLDEKISA